MATTYKTIVAESTGSFKDRGSKFIAHAFPVSHEEDVKECQGKMKSLYPDAGHHVYAFVLGAEGKSYRYSDDGEPANSSGPPVHGQIQSEGLTNILIIVVRYFGGTKLGVGGLINAYRSAASDALSNAIIIEREELNYGLVTFDYPETSAVNLLINKYAGEKSSERFEATCSVIVAVTDEGLDGFKEELALLNNTSYKFIERK